MRLQIDETDRIAQSLPCVGCRYDLRGLEPTGTCPECGKDIERSARGELLRFAHPKWVRRLAIGADCIIIGTIFSLLTIGWGFHTPLYERLWYLGWWLVPGIVALFGYYLITRPDPEGIGHGPSAGLRHAVLIVALLKFVLNGWQATFASQHHDEPMPVLREAVSNVVSLAFILVVGHFAMQLAQRLAPDTLLKRTRLVMWGLFGGLVGVVVMGSVIVLLDELLGFGQASPGTVSFIVEKWGRRVYSPWAAVTVPFLLGVFVFALWALGLMFRYWRELAKEATVAERRASKASAGTRM